MLYLLEIDTKEYDKCPLVSQAIPLTSEGEVSMNHKGLGVAE